MLFIKTGIALYFAAIAIAAPQPQDTGEDKSGNGASSGVTGIIGRQINTGDLGNVLGAVTGGDLSNVAGAVTGGDLSNVAGAVPGGDLTNVLGDV